MHEPLEEVALTEGNCRRALSQQRSAKCSWAANSLRFKKEVTRATAERDPNDPVRIVRIAARCFVIPNRRNDAELKAVKMVVFHCLTFAALPVLAKLAIPISHETWKSMETGSAR